MLQAFATPAYVSRFLFYALLSVAGCCAPGGVRVVSTGVRLCGDCRPCGSRSEKATALGSSVYGGNRSRSCADPLLIHKSFPPLPHLTSTHIKEYPHTSLGSPVKRGYVNLPHHPGIRPCVPYFSVFSTLSVSSFFFNIFIFSRFCSCVTEPLQPLRITDKANKNVPTNTVCCLTIRRNSSTRSRFPFLFGRCCSVLFIACVVTPIATTAGYRCSDGR